MLNKQRTAEVNFSAIYKDTERKWSIIDKRWGSLPAGEAMTSWTLLALPFSPCQ